MARTQLQQPDAIGALADIKIARSLAPGNPLVLATLGQAEYLLGTNDAYREAVADETVSLKIQPSLRFARMIRGAARYYVGDLNGAIKDETAVLAGDRNGAFALRFRGAAYAEQGRFAESIRDETASLEADPSSSFAYQIRGEVRYVTGDRAGAIVDEQAAIRIAPSTLAYEILGDSKRDSGDVNGAADAYLAALQIDACDASVGDKLNRLPLRTKPTTTPPPCTQNASPGTTLHGIAYPAGLIFYAELVRFVAANGKSNHTSTSPHHSAALAQLNLYGKPKPSSGGADQIQPPPRAHPVAPTPAPPPTPPPLHTQGGL